MCISQPDPAKLADPNPQLPSAQDLTLGGASGLPRGSALLGRLKLRADGGGAGPASSPPSAATASPAGNAGVSSLALATTAPSLPGNVPQGSRIITPSGPFS